MSVRIRAALAGPGVELGHVPATDVAKLITGIQRALAAAAAAVTRQERKSATGRYPQVIEAASRLRLAGIERGSVASIFVLPEVENKDETLGFDAQHLAEVAYARLLRDLTAPDDKVDWSIARAVSNLCSDLNIGERNTLLHLGYANQKSQVTISSEVRSRMARISGRSDVSRPDHLSGTLVEADFEKYSARLVPQYGPPVAVEFSENEADAVQEALRSPADLEGEITFDPRTGSAKRIEVRSLSAREQLALEAPSEVSFWRHQGIEELAVRQGIFEPQNLEDISSKIPFSDDEISAYFAGDDE